MQKRSLGESGLIQGIFTAFPICLGYLPIGFAFGILAQKSGLSVIEVCLMSMVLFAGSAQFITIAMINGGFSFFSIISTIFIVNLRHFLMSSTLSIYLKNENRFKLAFMAHTITDESFVVNIQKFKEGKWDLNRTTATNYTAYFAWFISSVFGYYGGEFIPPNSFGINYALIAMFICLLIFQLNGKIYLIVAIVSGVLSVTLSLFISGTSYIILASLFAPTAVITLKRVFYGR